MGLANWLTVLRIVLIPAFVALLVYRRPAAALVVFVFAALTDSLDGYVARRRRSQTRLGAFLDPTADKLLLTTAFAMLTYLRILPAWIMIVVISRDVILVVGALIIHMAGGRIYPRPTWAGKLATFFQILTVGLGLLAHSLDLALTAKPIWWLAAIFTTISGLQYVVQGLRYLNATDAAEREERDDSILLR